MDTVQALLVAFIGGGALVSLIQALSTRAKIKAEAHAIEHGGLGKIVTDFSEAANKILSSAEQSILLYEKALVTSTSQIEALEIRVKSLEETLFSVNEDVVEKNKLITQLQKENGILKSQVDHLRRDLKSKDKTIADLNQRIKDLESRFNGNFGGDA